jgi:hypothetical protein
MRKAVLIALLTSGLLMIPFLVHAEVYKWVDKRSGIHFTDDYSKILEKYRSQPEREPPIKGSEKISQKSEKEKDFKKSNGVKKEFQNLPTPIFVVIDKTMPSYTLYLAIPEGLSEEKLEELKKEAAKEKGLEIVTWGKFKQDPHKFITGRIIKNEYPQFEIEKGMVDLVKTAGLLVPIGLTWNGGVAFTHGDYEHVKETYQKYQDSPVEYERTRIRDPSRDPVNPGNHFVPLLGNAYLRAKPTKPKEAKVNWRQGMFYLETADFIFCFPPGFESVQPRYEEPEYLYGNDKGDSINVTQYDYLIGKELNEQLCRQIAREFDTSELRTKIGASEAMEVTFRYDNDVRSCYYNYDFSGPTGKVHLEHKVYQREVQQAYAITIVYSAISPDQATLRKALHSFSIKKEATDRSNP